MTRRIRLVAARQFSNLQPNLAMWCPEASDFLKALTNTFTNFSFEYTIALICAGRNKSARANFDVATKSNVTN